MSYRPGSNTYGTEATTNNAPAAAPLEDAAADAPNEEILIRGFKFDNCAAAGCDNMPPCPVHQPEAWQAAINRKWGERGSKQLGHEV